MSDDTAKNPAGIVPGKPAAKASSADYPVEEADRLSQQERLRKAAAAGAHALKSPLGSMLSRAGVTAAPPSSPANAPEGSTQTTGPEEPMPKTADEPALPLPADQSPGSVQSQEAESILFELRKISAWAETQRKMTKWSLGFLAVFIPTLILFGVFMEQRLKPAAEQASPSREPDWYEVDRGVRLGDFDKAIAVGEDLIQKTPLYPEAHKRLAGAYLAAGKIDKAREHFAEAYRLFPSEENEKQLAAIEKRSNAEKP